jgi:hypothetical protein
MERTQQREQIDQRDEFAGHQGSGWMTACPLVWGVVQHGMDIEREAAIKVRFSAVSATADERTLRRWAGGEAASFGRGGIAAVVRVTGMSPNTVRSGIAEIEGKGPPIDAGRQRRRGAGRVRAVLKDKTLYADLNALIEPVTRGDPEGPLRWTSKSLVKLSDELHALGHSEASPSLISDLLYDLGYSLQANAKTLEGSSHPDRDAQFNHIANRVREYQLEQQPVISVDTKKKELVGAFKNDGEELRPVGKPEEVNVHDFVNELGRANPYGVYDISQNEGWVSVGTDHDTAAFAIHTIERWWQSMGAASYPDAKRLLITADGGGSNGSRLRLWKIELAGLATRLGMPISVSHLPPGTSKWNKIEHRMFSHISMNWRGKPLIDHETIVSLIGATTTKKGLHIRAEVDPGKYPTGIKIERSAIDALPMTGDTFHPEWNYTIHPQP